MRSRGGFDQRCLWTSTGISLLIITLISISCQYEAPTEPSDYSDTELEETTTDILGIYTQSPDVYEQVIASGGKVVNLPKEGTFFVFWLPEGFSELAEKRVMVMLHGTDGNAYQRITMLHDVASSEKFGIVSIQWGWPAEDGGEYSYMEPISVFGIIVKALDYLEAKYGIDKHISAWDGFSRASTLCAEYAFWDKALQTDFFTLFIAVSGGCTEGRPMMSDLLDGKYGPEPISGSHFYFWCGEEDVAGVRCLRMKDCRRMVESMGGSVDIFRSCPNEGHGGYYHNPSYQLEAVQLWKSIKRDA